MASVKPAPQIRSKGAVVGLAAGFFEEVKVADYDAVGNGLGHVVEGEGESGDIPGHGPILAIYAGKINDCADYRDSCRPTCCPTFFKSA